MSDNPFEHSVRKKSKTPVLDNFARSFEDIVASEELSGKEYFSREKEIKLLLKNIIKNTRPHLIIKGSKGVGKESLLKSTFLYVKNKRSIRSINRYEFRHFRLGDLISGTKYRGQFEERLKAIKNEISKSGPLILFFSDFIDFIGNAQETHSYEIYSFIRNSDAKVVINLTHTEFERAMDYDANFVRYFNVFELTPPNKAESLEIIKLKINEIKNTYNFKITSKTVNTLYDLANLYMPEYANPYKSIILTEEICASMEIERADNPNGKVLKIQKRHEKLLFEMDEIHKKKQIVIKKQNYEEASILRNEEKLKEEELEKLEDEMDECLRSTTFTIKEKDIVRSISALSGIDIKTIEKRENILQNVVLSEEDTINGLPKFEVLQNQSILQGNTINIRRGTSFVLLPHTTEYEALFYNNIKPALESHGLSVLKANNIYQPGNILVQIWEHIRSAEVIIVDVSTNNSNVIFELGLCFGIQRCPIILTRVPENLPFNLRNLRYIQYEDSAAGASKLKESIESTVGEFLSAVR